MPNTTLHTTPTSETMVGQTAGSAPAHVQTMPKTAKTAVRPYQIVAFHFALTLYLLYRDVFTANGRYLFTAHFAHVAAKNGIRTATAARPRHVVAGLGCRDVLGTSSEIVLPPHRRAKERRRVHHELNVFPGDSLRVLRYCLHHFFHHQRQPFTRVSTQRAARFTAGINAQNVQTHRLILVCSLSFPYPYL
jgi:hypothetical protein